MRLAAVALVLAFAVPAAAQDHTAFTMVRPVATGAAGTGLDADNRVYRAYTGITYSINATARGGEWPYTYALSNAPAGMTIVAGPCTVVGPTCDAGLITWVNPASTASNIVVTVTDRDGDTVQGTWTVTVGTTACGTARGYCFIDAVGGNDTTGNGSLSTPYQTLAKVWNTVSADSTILYLRAGTYAVTGMTQTTPGDCVQQVAWAEGTRPVVWIGYPGETAIVNFGSNGGAAVPCMELTGQNSWVDNLTLKDIGSIGFQFIRSGRYGAVVRYVTGDHLRDGEDQNNSAYFMWVAQDTAESYYDTVQNSAFTGVAGDGGVDDNGDGIGSDDGSVLKLYSTIGLVAENNTVATDALTEAVFAIKAAQQDFTLRGNTCAADVTTCIGGNMASRVSSGGIGTRGEIHHNNCKGSGTGSSQGCLTIGVSRVNAIGAIYMYRNTWQGKINLQSVQTADGLFTFTRDVIVNAGGSASPAICDTMRATCTSIADSARIINSGDSLRGAAADSIIDAAGELIGTYLTTYGPNSSTPTGHMIGVVEQSPGPTYTSVSPSSGPSVGGTGITITGAAFVDGATITVGGATCTGVGFTSATTLTCTTPAHAAGAATIVITNPDLQTATGTNVFTYVLRSINVRTLIHMDN